MKKKQLLGIIMILLSAIFLLVACTTKTQDRKAKVVSEEIVINTQKSVTNTEKECETVSQFESVEGSQNILDKLQIAMLLPSDATRASYAIIENAVAQISFRYHFVGYTYRGSKSYKDQSLDGIYSDFTDEYSNIELNGADFELYTTEDGNRLVSWCIDDVNFSLYSDKSVNDEEIENLLLSLVFCGNCYGSAMDTAESMLPIFQGMNSFLYKNGNEYLPENDTFYWNSLCYVANACKELLKENSMLTQGEYKITQDAVSSLAATLYGTRKDFSNIMIPFDSEDKIRYEKEKASYYIAVSDVEANPTVITFASMNNVGTLIIEAQYLDANTQNILAVYHYTLVTIQDKEKGLFPYAITKVSAYKSLQSIESQE